MTELTPREILDAIRRGLEETARRLGKDKSGQTPPHTQPGRPATDTTEQDSKTQRQS
jgi:hypothetical protein